MQERGEGASHVAKAVVERHRAAYTVHLCLSFNGCIFDYDAVQPNLLIVANAMTDVVGVVDEVVVGEGDALRVSRRSRGELGTYAKG